MMGDSKSPSSTPPPSQCLPASVPAGPIPLVGSSIPALTVSLQPAAGAESCESLPAPAAHGREAPGAGPVPPLDQFSAVMTLPPSDGDDYGSYSEANFLDFLPPGYRFHPQDGELVIHYLKNKIAGRPLPPNKIYDIKISEHNPDSLAAKYPQWGENKWYFFSPRDRKYPNGRRPNRAAGKGYWKATGSDKPVFDPSGACVGTKKALVFYRGRPPNGDKTNWIMNEYKILNESQRRPDGTMKLDEWVLCSIHESLEGAAKRKKRGHAEANEQCPTPGSMKNSRESRERRPRRSRSSLKGDPQSSCPEDQAAAAETPQLDPELEPNVSSGYQGLADDQVPLNTIAYESKQGARVDVDQLYWTPKPLNFGCTNDGFDPTFMNYSLPGGYGDQCQYSKWGFCYDDYETSGGDMISCADAAAYHGVVLGHAHPSSFGGAETLGSYASTPSSDDSRAYAVHNLGHVEAAPLLVPDGALPVVDFGKDEFFPKISGSCAGGALAVPDANYDDVHDPEYYLWGDFN